MVCAWLVPVIKIKNGMKAVFNLDNNNVFIFNIFSDNAGLVVQEGILAIVLSFVNSAYLLHG